MSRLPPRRVDGRAGHRTPKPLPDMPVEPAPRRRRPRRPGRRLRRLDGADRHLRARRRRVGARPPLRGLLHGPPQPHRGRRQPARPDAARGAPARAAAVPARVAWPAVNGLILPGPAAAGILGGPMSRRNALGPSVEIVRSYYAAWNESGVRGVLPFWTADFEW